MRPHETHTQDHQRSIDDQVPPSMRSRRWLRSTGAVAPVFCDAPGVDPAPDLDDQIEAAGEQPAS